MANFVLDTFTGSTGTELSSHTGEVGATWSRHNYSDTYATLSGSGSLQATNTVAWYTASGTPGTDEYDVTVTCTLNPADSSLYLGLRGSATADTGYLIGWTRPNRWELYRNLSTATSQSDTLSTGTYTLKATIRNNGSNAELALFLDGTQVLSYTDSSPITGAGVTGFDLNTPGSTTFDSFRADDTLSAGALTIGPLTATGSTDAITLSVAAPLAGGSGTGYAYRIYRGTTPDFVVGTDTLLTTAGSLPYSDTTAVADTDYYYRLIGADDAEATVNAEPAALVGVGTTSPLVVCARRLLAPIAIVFCGDSITAGAPANPGIGPCAETCEVIAAWSEPRSVIYSNQGSSGTQTSDWLPEGTLYRDALSATPADDSAAYQLTQANPGCQLVVTIGLGTNDSAYSVTPTAYAANLNAIIAQIHTDWPTAIVVLHAPIWHSPNGHNALVYGETSLGLLTGYAAQIAALADGHVTFAGATNGYAHFARNYQTQMTPESGSDGTFFLHPNASGNLTLGKFWGTATIPALTRTLGGHGGFPSSMTGFPVLSLESLG